MTVLNQKLVAELSQRGVAEFANWNQHSFDSFVQGPAKSLVQYLSWSDKDDPDPQTHDNYLRLVFQGVGAGWLADCRVETPPTFLHFCLAQLVVYGIRQVKKPQRSQVLQNVWNLGEGLAREPQWLNQFAIARTDWSVDLESLAEHLATTLAPVLSPLPPAHWNGEATLQILDLREHSEAFVPGRMYLASPALLCIEDRLDSHETLGVLLQKGACEVIGSVGRLPTHVESFDQPAILTTTDEIVLNDQTIAAPRLGVAEQTLCVASGFVAICVEDSQRLWLLEAA